MNPQLTLEPGDEGSGGLALVRDILFAPGRAFRTIDRSGEWFSAYAVVTICGLTALALYAPALTHVILSQPPTIPETRGQSAPQLHELANNALAEESLRLTVGTLIAWGISAFTFATVAMLCGKDARLRTYFSLSANCQIPAAIGQLVAAAAIRTHDPSTFHTFRELNLAFPLSLAVLHPAGNDAEIAFLSFWDAFQVWSLLLAGFGFAAIAKIGSLGALALSAGLGLVFALLSTLI